MSSENMITEYGLISTDFSKAKLADLCVDKGGVQTGPFGSQLHQEDYVALGTPIITVEHLGDNRILHQNTPFVSDSDKERLSKYKLKEGDIVFSRVGSVDRRALVRKDEEGWLFSGRCLRVRVNKELIDPIYLSYFFGLNSFKNYIRAIAVGATMPSINTKILSEAPIYFPSLSKQKKIAKVLYELDEKIQLNHQINQTLEEIAQAIFKSWFVDFDPVKAKIAAKENGQDPERAAMCAISGKNEEELDQLSTEQLKQLARTASLFPDKLSESELGLIPNGWKGESFGQLLKLAIGGDWGKDKPTDKFTEKVKILRGTDLPNIYKGDDTTCPVRYIEKSKLDKRKLSNGDIVIEVSGGSKNQPTGRSLYITDTLLTRLDFVVVPASFCRLLRPKRIEYGLLLANHLQKIYNDGKMWTYQIQSTGLSNFQTQVFLESEIVIVPNDEILKIFYRNTKLIYDKIYQSESKMLTELRDTLLSKLLSGEISIQQE